MQKKYRVLKPLTYNQMMVKLGKPYKKKEVKDAIN
jgi:hypothetical protein